MRLVGLEELCTEKQVSEDYKSVRNPLIIEVLFVVSGRRSLLVNVFP